MPDPPTEPVVTIEMVVPVPATIVSLIVSYYSPDKFIEYKLYFM